MQFSKEMMKGAAEVIVLKALADNGEAYGYELIQLIARQSGNIFEFQEGTLYPLLYRLEERGYVSSNRQMASNGKIRRYYTITTKGKKLLGERTKELAIFSAGIAKLFSLKSV